MMLALVTGGVSVAQEAAVGSALGNAKPTVDESTLAIADAPATGARSASAQASSNTLSYFLRMIVVLAIVLGAMYLVLRFVKGISKPRNADDSAIRVLDYRSIGSGRSLYVVALGGKAWLLSSSESAVGVIAEIEDKELIDGLELKAASGGSGINGGSRRDFSTMLGELINKGKKPNSKPRSSFSDRDATQGAKSIRDALGSGDYLSRQKDRLKKFKEPGL